MTSKRVLIITEWSALNTGYAVYARELLKGLHSTGKYDILELAKYAEVQDPRINQVPWKVVPNLPNPQNQQEVQAYNSNPLNTFGLFRFDSVCLQFKPHVVITYADFWFDHWVDFSPARPYFNWQWLVTCDAQNQSAEWLDVYSRVDQILTYNDWAKKTLEEESRGRIKVSGIAPPYVNMKPLNKDEVKKHFGLSDKLIFGTVMRNQRRKLFPALFDSFRKFLDQSGRNDILLYAHTSWPDDGWPIPALLHHYGVSSKVLFTYVCRKCGMFFPSFFSDAITSCVRCGQNAATLANTKVGLSPEDMCVMYNLMDLYIQYSNSEGFGISQTEAAACGVPVIATDYSAMEDVIRKLNGEPIKLLSKEFEMETSRYMAIPSNLDLIDKLLEFCNLPQQLRLQKGMKALQGFKENYNWDKTVKTWENTIDSVNQSSYDNKWKSPPNYINLPNPPDLPPRQFLRWLMSYVGKLDTYFEAKLLKQMHYGLIHNNNYTRFMDDLSMSLKTNVSEFNREHAYNYVKTIIDVHNQFEKIRTNV